MVILGAGTFARELEDQYGHSCLFIVDDGFYNGELDVVPFSKFESWLMFEDFNEKFICAIVSVKRKTFINKFSKWPFTNFVHPFTYMSKKSQIDIGSIIAPGVVIASNSYIKKHVIVNRNASIGHDCIIGSYSTIGPGVNIAGGVTIGEQTMIGLGANILEGRTIGSNCVIGAGSLVTKDIADGETWWGVPARNVGKNVR